MKSKLFALAGLALSLGTAACGGQADAANAAPADAAATTEAAAPAAPSVALTGNVIEVKMVTDGEGNYFEPAEIVAKPGDVVRFSLVSGVHNVSFPAADNPTLSTLPASSPYLQLPGQTFDLTVDMPAGEYKFVCDPHAALGMVGKLTVQ